jgi:hypothetical protein
MLENPKNSGELSAVGQALENGRRMGERSASLEASLRILANSIRIASIATNLEQRLKISQELHKLADGVMKIGQDLPQEPSEH